MEFTVGSRTIEIKFDYMLMFKVNKDLSTRDDNGGSNEDGVGALFLRIVERNDSALVDLIKLCASKKAKAVSDEEALSAIAAKLEELDATNTEPIFKAIEEEMVDSGFFNEKVLKYIGKLELALTYLKAKSETAEDQATARFQIEQMEAQIGRMKNALS
nr:MAG TPA: tail assembly chaperone protein [Caudoviricetes sp.]DAS42900.1 MAG TPA: tail assembly chaperone protein [Caudoviricetes sp.]